jgi:hypothetical protein
MPKLEVEGVGTFEIGVLNGGVKPGDPPLRAR